MYKKDYHQLVKAIFNDHNLLWDQKREEMRNYSDMYAIDFYRRLKGGTDGLVQVSDARAYVEAYISSLFSKAPSVRISEDIKANSGRESVAEAVVNRFLDIQEENITNACRLALIFPCSFFKIIPTSSEDVLESLALSVMKPWQIIVDRTASAWDKQRWVGCISTITKDSANQLYGNKDYSTETDIDYLTKNVKAIRNPIETPDEYQFIQVVELYDLVNLKRIIYTPNLRGGEILSTEDIPVINGNPLVPIIPVYFNINPEKPLDGFSFMRMIYDPIKEKNLLRSQQANIVRRDARQYLYPEGMFDEEALARLELGGDLTFVPFKGDSAQALSIVPTIPMSNNYSIYSAQIETDLQRSNLMASFTRGQSTNVTATEITALAQYTASEVGKLARVRDTAIEAIASIYLSMLSLTVEDSDNVALIVDYKATVLKAEDLEGKFRIVAIDQGALPIQKAAQKTEFMQVMPVLMQMGVDKQKILDHIAQLYELPPELVMLVKEPAPAPEAQPQNISQQIA